MLKSLLTIGIILWIKKYISVSAENAASQSATTTASISNYILICLCCLLLVVLRLVTSNNNNKEQLLTISDYFENKTNLNTASSSSIKGYTDNNQQSIHNSFPYHSNKNKNTNNNNNVIISNFEKDIPNRKRRDYNIIVVNNNKTKNNSIENITTSTSSPSHTSSQINHQMNTNDHNSMETRGGKQNHNLVLVVLLGSVLTAVAAITCIISYLQHYNISGTRPLTSSSSSSSPTTTTTTTVCCIQNNSNVRNSNCTATVPMLALEANMERERCVHRDRQVRLHSVHTDLELDLPHSIHLPDGEEIPYGSSTRLHIRDPEQESEIYRKCIRAPPNRTIDMSECVDSLPYRSNSAGLLSLSGSTNSSSNSSSDWSHDVIRCHSMTSRYNNTRQLPSVILPVSRSQRQLSGMVMSGGGGIGGLSKITMIPCKTEHSEVSSSSAGSRCTNTSSLSSATTGIRQVYP